jgi:hypothetical protein
MADNADIAAANDYCEESLKALLTAKSVQVERGRCLYCDQPTTANANGQLFLYCDADCRRDYEHEAKTLAKTTNATGRRS